MNIKLDLPEHFLDEEVRSGYTVSHNMKKLWAVELDLFAEFDRVCKKYGIKYCACGGTMLGAIRHKGFIPWDDDMDVMMLRSEYNRLCSVAQNEFHYPYFFQTQYTDNGSLRRHAQLRNSETTGILSAELEFKFGFNQGIFLDIFPLDNVVENENLFERQKKVASIYKKCYIVFASFASRYKREENGIKSFVRFVGHTCFHKLFETLTTYCYRKYEQELSKYSDQETEFVSQLYWDFRKDMFRYREDIVNLIDVDFEFLKIPVPEKYKRALDLKFGNWKELVVIPTAHGGLIFDADKPYTEYLKEKI